jgi:hypothetical protein
VAVDLVGADLEVAAEMRLASRFEQDPGAAHVGLDERARIENRPIDVGLGGEVDDRVARGDERFDDAGIRDVALDEAEAPV